MEQIQILGTGFLELLLAGRQETQCSPAEYAAAGAVAWQRSDQTIVPPDRKYLQPVGRGYVALPVDVPPGAQPIDVEGGCRRGAAVEERLPLGRQGVPRCLVVNNGHHDF